MHLDFLNFYIKFKKYQYLYQIKKIKLHLSKYFAVHVMSNARKMQETKLLQILLANSNLNESMQQIEIKTFKFSNLIGLLKTET